MTWTGNGTIYTNHSTKQTDVINFQVYRCSRKNPVTFLWLIIINATSTEKWR